MPVLDYNKDKHLFTFPMEYGSTSFPGLSVKLEQGGRSYVFDDVSPGNYYNLRAFKAFYGKNGTATRRAVERIEEIKRERDEDFLAKYGSLLSGTPYEHQLVTINEMQRSDRLALLIEQGLGKTYIALQAMKLFKARDGFLHALVVCPNIVYQSWMAEVDKFAPELSVMEYRGNLEARMALRQEIKNFDVLITTYDMLRGSVAQNILAYCGFGWERLPEDRRKEVAEAYGQPVLSENPKKMSATARRTWRSACAKILGSPLDHMAWRRKAGEFPSARRSLLDYENNVRQMVLDDTPEKYFNTLGLSVVVFDEASKLVSPKSQQSRAAEQLIARRKYLMSGTLCVGRPTDMYMPMRVLDPSILGMNWFQFMNKYCTFSSYNEHIITGYRNLDDLKRRIDPYSVAFTREECLDLPDRTIVTCYYAPDPKVVKLYDEVVEADDVVYLDKDTPVFCTLQIQKIQKCLQLMSGFINTSNAYKMCRDCPEDRVWECAMLGVKPGSLKCHRKAEFRESDVVDITRDVVDVRRNAKLQMLEEDLTSITPTEKVIVWYWYQHDYEQICDLLDRLGIRYITATEENCAIKFESDESIRVFLGQTVQGIGITLNSATTTIYFSHGLALEPRLQSMDRNLRIGQAKPVIVRDYVCKGSIEEAVVELLQHKRDVKDFMQTSIECIACDNMRNCLENHIRRYGKGCIHHNQLKQAEEKRTIYLRPIGDIYHV